MLSFFLEVPKLPDLHSWEYRLYSTFLSLVARAMIYSFLLMYFSFSLLPRFAPEKVHSFLHLWFGVCVCARLCDCHRHRTMSNAVWFSGSAGSFSAWLWRRKPLLLLPLSIVFDEQDLPLNFYLQNFCWLETSSSNIWHLLISSSSGTAYSISYLALIVVLLWVCWLLDLWFVANLCLSVCCCCSVTLLFQCLTSANRLPLTAHWAVLQVLAAAGCQWRTGEWWHHLHHSLTEREQEVLSCRRRRRRCFSRSERTSTRFWQLR